MRLNSLRFTNYRLFSDLTVPVRERLTVIVGENNAGKTSVLEGAAVALGTLLSELGVVPRVEIRETDVRVEESGLGEDADLQAQYPIRIFARGHWGDKGLWWTRGLDAEANSATDEYSESTVGILQELRQGIKTGDKTLLLPVFAYYGFCRSQEYPQKKRTSSTKRRVRTDAYAGCLDGIINTQQMMGWFRKMVEQSRQQGDGLGATPELGAIYQALEACFMDMTGYSGVAIRYNADIDDLDISYATTEGMRTCIPMSRLGSGHYGVISLIADIAYRMAVLNPQLEGRVLEKTEGIVLVDEITSHLHPRLRQRVIGYLTRTFPKVQFIVTTHSPEVVSSVHTENLIILKDGWVMMPRSQVYGKDVKSVLREIMGVDDRPDEVVQLFDLFYEYLKQQNFSEAERVLDELDELREYHDPEVCSCRVKLRLEKVRGGVA